MAQASDEAESAGKGSGKKKLILLVVVLLLLLGGGGGAAYFFLLSGGDDAAVVEEASAVPVRQAAVYTKVRTLEGKPMFVISLQSNDNQRHYLQAYVEAKSRDQVVADALTLHMPVVVARLNALFSSQNFETLMTIDGKRALQQQALETVQSIMQDKIGRPGVEAILFTNFVMQ